MSEETKQAGWKDRNLYVSITGFWGEYKKHRIGLIGLFVLIMYFGIAIFAPVISQGVDPSPTNKVAPPFLAPSWMAVFDPTGVVTGELSPDPYLNVNPNATSDPVLSKINIVRKNGTNTDPFDYAYGDGYVNLTWTHTAGTEYWWKPELDNLPLGQILPRTEPQVNDFIMFEQELPWLYQTMPSDVNMTFELGVKLNGDFTRTYGGLMFKIYIYLIDSAGNWWQVYESVPPYESLVVNRRIDLSGFDVVEGWEGITGSNETGSDFVKDPEPWVKVGVVLSPTRNFRERLSPSNPDDFPYLVYNGSVEVHVTTLSTIAYGPYYGILGTTDKGGDAWSQLIYGTRISLIIGILATGLSTAVGVIVGLVAGYFGGKIDEALMRVVDFLLVIPGLPLMMVLAAFLGPTIGNIILVISILGWTGTSRLIRSQVMAEKNKAYVESAKAIGASDTYIIFRHILPNVTPILFANITLGVVGAILSESGLAFLGLTDPSEPSWGRMLADAQTAGGFSNGAWWVVVFPGLMITALSLSFTFIGHTLDQVLNPRLRER